MMESNEVTAEVKYNKLVQFIKNLHYLDTCEHMQLQLQLQGTRSVFRSH